MAGPSLKPIRYEVTFCHIKEIEYMIKFPFIIMLTNDWNFYYIKHLTTGNH